MKYTIIAGNPVEGFECYGVFDSNEEACAWGNTDPHVPDEWWVIPINPID